MIDIDTDCKRIMMALLSMEHYLVLTDDIHMTRDFYQNILQLKEGKRPDLGFPGCWLYLDGTPVIHIAEWQTYTAHSLKQGIPVSSKAASTGAFDHIAFNASNCQEMIALFIAKNIPFQQNNVPSAKLTQLFLNDPNGLKIELNYFD